MYRISLLLAAFLFFGFIDSRNVQIKKQKIGAVELAYYMRGSGEPLVLVMGFKGTMAMWDPRLVDELAKHYLVILFDNRGVGLSTDSKENQTTIQQMSKDTAEFIHALGYQKVHLLGWSMGTSIAMQFVLDHPEMVKTLILCAPNPGGKNQAFRKDVYEKLTSPKLTEDKLLFLMFPDTPQGNQASKEYMENIKKAIENGSVPNDLTVSQQTVDRQNSALKLRGEDEHLVESLAAIKAPTLVAGGLKDVICLPENTRAVANRIPYAWTAYFPESGHEFISQEYLQFSRLVHVFIDSQNP